ncbi:MAG: hypothetical protein G01um101456_490 [Parcubacteria group bacterium Gr01-1014_56]|nr:MAG: hypothetical protein G01um101456_490 [Parcubacteria group bacterium Gr01-1014_56]
MQSLSYISAYMHRKPRAPKGMRPFSINLVTNFTDEVLERVLGGMCLAEGIYPQITRTPYKQYALAFKNKKSEINTSKPDISYIFFDASPYAQSEFLSSGHRKEVLADIERYAKFAGTVVVGLFALPYHGPYGEHFTKEPLFVALSDFNTKLQALAKKNSSIHIFDTNKAFARVGELRARDLRGHHAFDMPFTTDFLIALASSWLTYARAILGLSRKCIVLDLDNTLWGGIVGEDGALGVLLGPEYPGLAYQNFQRALLSMWERGVILAINSKNNEADVDEVFEKNPHMILKKEHIAAMRVNWDDKSKNSKEIAQELNIGMGSMVFIDDSPLERERMREEAPEILTPEWSFEPEQYVKELFSLGVFHQMSLTSEDKKKGQMYVEESKRKKVRATSRNVKEYIKKLNIKMQVREGKAIDIARVAQLTQKTNQFNLTTKRYQEADISRMIKKGDLVITGDVGDTFGGYGVVILGIVKIEKKQATLDTFLMSCRVMGRGVEEAFFEHIIKQLHTRGVERLKASFIPTPKNKPASKFLSTFGIKSASPVALGSLQSLTCPRSASWTHSHRRTLQLGTRSMRLFYLLKLRRRLTSNSPSMKRWR